MYVHILKWVKSLKERKVRTKSYFIMIMVITGLFCMVPPRHGGCIMREHGMPLAHLKERFMAGAGICSSQFLKSKSFLGTASEIKERRKPLSWNKPVLRPRTGIKPGTQYSKLYALTVEPPGSGTGRFYQLLDAIIYLGQQSKILYAAVLRVCNVLKLLF